jgi:hypothetical protein
VLVAADNEKMAKQWKKRLARLESTGKKMNFERKKKLPNQLHEILVVCRIRRSSLSLNSEPTFFLTIFYPIVTFFLKLMCNLLKCFISPIGTFKWQVTT